MRPHLKLSRAVLLFMAVTAAACIDSNSCASATVTMPNPTPSASPTPSPAPSASPGVSAASCSGLKGVFAAFGWTGPASVTRPPNQAQPYPLCPTCSALVTGTVKGVPNANGNADNGDVPVEVTGTSRLGGKSPTWTVPVGADVVRVTVNKSSNEDGYNVDVTPLANGTATVRVRYYLTCKDTAPLDADWQVTVGTVG